MDSPCTKGDPRLPDRLMLVLSTPVGQRRPSPSQARISVIYSSQHITQGTHANTMKRSIRGIWFGDGRYYRHRAIMTVGCYSTHSRARGSQTSAWCFVFGTLCLPEGESFVDGVKHRFHGLCRICQTRKTPSRGSIRGQTTRTRPGSAPSCLAALTRASTFS